MVNLPRAQGGRHMQDKLTGHLVADAGVGGAAAVTAKSNASRSSFAAQAADWDGACAVY